jgi:hypothetical protein
VKLTGHSLKREAREVGGEDVRTLSSPAKTCLPRYLLAVLVTPSPVRLLPVVTPLFRLSPLVTSSGKRNWGMVSNRTMSTPVHLRLDPLR